MISFIWISARKGYKITTTLALLYLFQTVNFTCQSAEQFADKDSKTFIILDWTGYTCQLLVMTLFTCAYISVATQTPLLQ